MDNHKIDNWAKDSLSDREIQPRPQVWDALEKALQNEATPAPAPKKKSGIRLWWFMLAGLICFGIFWQMDQKSENGPMAKDTEASNISTIPVQNVSPVNAMPVETETEVETASQAQPEIENQEEKPVIRTKHNTPVQFIHQKNKPESRSKAQPKQSGKPEQVEVESAKESEKPVYAQNQTSETKKSDASVIESFQNQAVAGLDINIKSRKPDPKALLAEVQNDMASSQKKYHIDPKELLRVAEKENNETFLRKMLKTVSETSTSVIAMVNNRNVEP